MSTISDDTSHLAKGGPPSPTPNTTPKDKPFPFLALPKELRFMVYKRIPVRVYERTDNDNGSKFEHPTAFIATCTSVGILATSRQIHAEASAIMSDKLNTILRTPVRVIVGVSHLCHLYDESWSLFPELANHVSAVKDIECLKTEPNPLFSDDDDDEDNKSAVLWLDGIRTMAVSKYPRKWFLHFEKQFQLLCEGDIPRVEIGIWYYEHPRDEERLCRRNLDTYADDAAQYSQDHLVLEIYYRMIQDRIPAPLLRELEGRSASNDDPLDIEDLDMPETGALIDSEE
jgi:hypothetical protein